MNNKYDYSKLYSLDKSDYYLTSNNDEYFQRDEWNNNNILNFEENIPINDDYNKEYYENKRYSFMKNKKQAKKF